MNGKLWILNNNDKESGGEREMTIVDGKNA